MPNQPPQPPVIRVVCPRLTCLLVLAVPSSARGQLVRCARCEAIIRVPAQAESEAA